MVVFTQTQQIALATLPKITAFLSVLGSGWIAVEVMTERTKRQNVFNRMLCALSLFDVVHSSFYFASTWPIPEGTSNVYAAIGNDATCSIQGIAMQLGVATPIYYTTLSIYYLLVFRYSVTEESMRRYLEPITHFIAIGFAFSTSITGIFLSLYHFADLWCWIANDESSSSSFEESDDPTFWYRMGFFYIPLWICLFLVTVVTLAIYWTLREQEKELMRRRQLLAEERDATRSFALSEANKTRSTGSVQGRRSNGSSAFYSLDDLSLAFSATSGTGPSSSNRNVTSHNASTAQNQTFKRTNRTNVVISRKTARALQTFGTSLGLSKGPRHHRERKKADRKHDKEEVKIVLDVVESFTSARMQRSITRETSSRVIWKQSLYYSLAFYASFTFPSINRVVQYATGTTFFPIILLHAMSIPSLGFFNALVYRRQVFLRLKQRNPTMGPCTLIRRTWTWTFLNNRATHCDPIHHLHVTSKAGIPPTVSTGISKREGPAIAPINGNSGTAHANQHSLHDMTALECVQNVPVRKDKTLTDSNPTTELKEGTTTQHHSSPEFHSHIIQIEEDDLFAFCADFPDILVEAQTATEEENYMQSFSQFPRMLSSSGIEPTPPGFPTMVAQGFATIPEDDRSG